MIASLLRVASTPQKSVLIVGISWPPETFLLHLIKGLLDRGQRITIACINKPDNDVLSNPALRWIPIVPWDGHPFSRFIQLLRLTAAALLRSPADVRHLVTVARQDPDSKAIFQLLNRLLPFAGYRWDVVYFPWNLAAIAYLGLFMMGSPVIISCRGSQINVAPHNPRRSVVHAGLKEVFGRAKAVHCVSFAIRDEALQYGLDPTKAWVIHPAVDTELFSPANDVSTQNKVLRLITVGSLIWRKGYEYALLATRHLVNRDVPVQFMIIGDGRERQRVHYTIKDLGLDNQVSLLGHLAAREIVRHLRESDIFVLSSLSEGIANSALEAMACGLPVVTTKCGGMREAITDGVEGFVVPVRKPQAMAHALEILWQNPAMRVSMGQAARKRILRDFTLSVQVQEFLRLLKMTANGCSCLEGSTNHR